MRSLVEQSVFRLLTREKGGFYFESVKTREVETFEALNWFGNRLYFNTMSFLDLLVQGELTFTRKCYAELMKPFSVAFSEARPSINCQRRRFSQALW